MILYYGILWGKGRVKRAARSLKVGSFILSERKAQERYKSVQEVCDVGKKN